MVAAWRQAPGIALPLRDLLDLRLGATRGARARPMARRSGVMASRQPGSGMDLREIRAYVPGDDPRRLDPSATARTGTPHVRALHEDRDDITLLIADFRAPMLWGTGAALRSVSGALHLAASGWQAVGRQGAVGLIVADPQGVRALPPTPGDRHMAGLCRLLADRHAAALDATPGPQASLTEALSLAAGQAPAGARVILTTAPDGWPSAQAALSRLARKRQLEVALILDPLELAPPARPLPVTHDGTARLARLQPADLGRQMDLLSALGALPRRVDP
ncbi:DUF58 domain-containing protein [Paracoccus gahaiensis]|uniref:DUF58 domain-containing protein n=1 Tax=Paracoccus gahaiensis TaxID=1706839 RepID=A0A4U0RCZ1_9RHOB|nr:DUF58 domain-containing protein [Paracoccus gahaiensis]TJZ92846.1 DUF58 domain-containing protein [Paracoccus gahaiensis]